MKEQHYKNHRQFIPLYHGLTLLLLLAFLIGSIRNLINSNEEQRYNASLLVVAALILASLYYHARTFALKAQDRAIRAEEGLRHFQLTGMPMDSRLTWQQIVALRFASDAELPELSRRAVTEKLDSNTIKKAIRHWRADWRRV